MSADLPILIVGGGIGGFAAARALSRTGRRVHLVEQASAFGEIGAGIQLGPNAFRALDRLGLGDAAKRLTVFVESTIMLDCVTGEEVARVPYGQPFVERFKQPYGVIHRADLHGLLVEACQSSDSITLETATRIGDVRETPSGVVATSLDGRTFEGVALIGADGLWSAVRAAILNDGKPRVSGHIAYRAVLPASEVPEHLRIWSIRFWGGEKTHLVCYPLRDGEHYNLVAVFHSDRFSEGWDSFGDANELHERFAGACADVRMLLDKIENWRMWVLCDRDPVSEWSRGRMTLLGDAAHPMLQYLAQGATMSMEDALCLADQVKLHNDDYAAAFRAYQGLRYRRTGRAQIMSRLYGEVFHASSTMREIRNEIFAGQQPQQSYASMAWMYDYGISAQPEPACPTLLSGVD